MNDPRSKIPALTPATEGTRKPQGKGAIACAWIAKPCHLPRPFHAVFQSVLPL